MKQQKVATTLQQAAREGIPFDETTPMRKPPVVQDPDVNLFGDLLPNPLLALKVKRLQKDAELPRYATPGAACFDIASDEDCNIMPGGQRRVLTGLAFEVPEGYVMLVYSRSGHGFRNSVRLANGTGVIDSDYRGELMVALRNDSDDLFMVRKGDRIAQGMLVPIPRCEIVDADELGETERGEGGLGSTGA